MYAYGGKVKALDDGLLITESIISSENPYMVAVNNSNGLLRIELGTDELTLDEALLLAESIMSMVSIQRPKKGIGRRLWEWIGNRFDWIGE